MQIYIHTFIFTDRHTHKHTYISMNYILFDKVHKPHVYMRGMLTTPEFLIPPVMLLISSRNSVPSIHPFSLLWRLRVMGHCLFCMFSLSVRIGYCIPASSVNSYSQAYKKVGILLFPRPQKLV